MTITKRTAKEALGIQTDADLARVLRIKRQALTKVADNDPLPEGRQWQLRAIRPDLFPAPGADTDAA
jgi:hypothetical protein